MENSVREWPTPSSVGRFITPPAAIPIRKYYLESLQCLHLSLILLRTLIQYFYITLIKLRTNSHIARQQK